jgi:phosphoglycolate phosphatase
VFVTKKRALYINFEVNVNNNKIILFDWDGTLVNSSNVIIDSIVKAAEEIGGYKIQRNDVVKMHGLPLKNIADDLIPEADFEMFTQLYRDNYFKMEKDAPLFDGVFQTLEFLKTKYLLAIVTNKHRLHLEKLLKSFRLEDFFVSISCGDDKYVKPDPMAILNVLCKQSIDKENAIMVGDSRYDMMAARDAGVRAIAVGYGIANKEELLKYSPVMCLEKFNELLELEI